MKKLKAMLILIISVQILSAPQTVNAKSSFSDVTDSHWAKENILKASVSGFVNGYPDGTFRPNNNVTRAEFIQLLNSVTKLQPVAPLLSKFSDVPDSYWAKDSIENAIAIGLIDPNDYKDGFIPGKALTRYEMSKWLVSGLVLSHSDFKDTFISGQSVLLASKDQNMITKEEMPYILVAKKAGLIQGFPDGSLGLDKTTTRAEAVTILFRYLALEGKGYSNTIVTDIKPSSGTEATHTDSSLNTSSFKYTVGEYKETDIGNGETLLLDHNGVPFSGGGLVTSSGSDESSVNSGKIILDGISYTLSTYPTVIDYYRNHLDIFKMYVKSQEQDYLQGLYNDLYTKKLYEPIVYKHTYEQYKQFESQGFIYYNNYFAWVTQGDGSKIIKIITSAPSYNNDKNNAKLFENLKKIYNYSFDYKDLFVLNHKL